MRSIRWQHVQASKAPFRPRPQSRLLHSCYDAEAVRSSRTQAAEEAEGRTDRENEEGGLARATAVEMEAAVAGSLARATAVAEAAVLAGSLARATAVEGSVP